MTEYQRRRASLDLAKGEQGVRYEDLPKRVRRDLRKDLEGRTLGYAGGYVYDAETGELLPNVNIDIVTHINDSHRQHAKRVDKLAEHNDRNGGFIFAFFKDVTDIRERFPSLTSTDIARLLLLGLYTSYDGGLLRYDNGRVIDKKELRKIVGVSRNVFNAFYNRVRDEGILVEDVEYGNKRLYVNNTVFLRGQIDGLPTDEHGEELRYARIYRDPLKRLAQEFGGRYIGKLAVIFLVIPFLNYQYNIITYDTEEKDVDRVSPMSLTELATELGFADPAALKREMDTLKMGKQYVFTFVENPHDRREWRVIVNPNVVYASSGKTLEALKAFFAE